MGNTATERVLRARIMFRCLRFLGSHKKTECEAAQIIHSYDIVYLYLSLCILRVKFVRGARVNMSKPMTKYESGSLFEVHNILAVRTS